MSNMSDIARLCSFAFDKGGWEGVADLCRGMISGAMQGTLAGLMTPDQAVTDAPAAKPASEAPTPRSIDAVINVIETEIDNFFR